MRVLIDTHAIIWWSENDRRLSGTAKALLSSEDQALLVSPASAYEMTFKFQLGKLPSATALMADLPGFLREQAMEELPISWRHAETAGRLSPDHRDPFDRLLIAQALCDDLALLSNDTAFDRFGVRRLW